eukprot:1159667-Pelagomonas_calceolata.AAC.5
MATSICLPQAASPISGEALHTLAKSSYPTHPLLYVDLRAQLMYCTMNIDPFFKMLQQDLPHRLVKEFGQVDFVHGNRPIRPPHCHMA